MEAAEVLKTLEKSGKPNTAKTYARHGVKDETWGVSYADLGKLQKKLKTDHALALELWKSKVHDARVLAAKIADPSRMTKRTINSWVKAVKDHVISGAVAALVSRMDAGEAIALEWIESRAEFTASTGWAALSELVLKGRIGKGPAKKLLARIKREIHGSPNRVRHTMNATLIAIGGSMPELEETAIATAKKIGKVEVDHGQTGCKTPDAIPYIEKMAKRRS